MNHQDCNCRGHISELEEIRLDDFERSELRVLWNEQAALSLLPTFDWLQKRKSNKMIWRYRKAWYQVLWLSIYPFISWLCLFVGVVAKTAFGNSKELLRMRISGLKWIYLLVLVPVLAVVSIFWNLTFHYAPSVTYRFMSYGAYFVLSKDMIANVDVTQALDEMTHGDKEVYSQAIAEYLALVSAITYTRNSALFSEAEQLYRQLVARYGKALPDQPSLERHPEARQTILNLMKSSETVMKDYADAIGLDVSVISELNTGFGGPTASMFSSKTGNVLIVAIRGTNPFDARELLVDAAFEKIAVDPVYFAFLTENCQTAQTHRGFYSSLFPVTHHTREDFPAKTIMTSILIKARELRLKHHLTGKVQVYVTGHSLGAALASLLTASFSAADHHLLDIVDLRCTYTYGTPMSSDAAFCASYNKNPVNKIFRVINDHDFVARLPPSINNLASDGGVGEMTQKLAITDGSLLDYSAIGRGVRYDSVGGLPTGIDAQSIVSHVHPDSTIGTVWWITLLRYTPLEGLVNHSLRDYSVSLKKARTVLQAVGNQGYNT